MMSHAQNLRHYLLAAPTLLLLPLTALAQFTNIALRTENRAVVPEFATALGDALEIPFSSEDDLDGSFGSLDRGFGTYLAPRADPGSQNSHIYFNPERRHDTSRTAPVRRGKSSLSQGPFLLALSMADALRDGTLMPSVFEGDRADWQVRARLP